MNRHDVEDFYRIFFDGMQKHFGDRWELEEFEIRFHAKLATMAANEQLPRLFANSQNKCLYAWMLATLVMIGTRSDAGVKLVEKISNLIQSLFEKFGGADQAPEEKTA